MNHLNIVQCDIITLKINAANNALLGDGTASMLLCMPQLGKQRSSGYNLPTPYIIYTVAPV